MPVVNEAQNLGDLLKYEADARYSREQVTIAANQTLALGAVVGRNTNRNNLRVLNPGASNGTEIAIGVMIEAVTTTTTPAQAVMITRHALVARSALVWPTDITDEQRETALTQLEARGIIAREGA